MNLTTKFDKTFLLETEKQKLDILTLISSRIQKAKEDKSLINFDPIDYKGVIVADDEIIIFRKPSMFNPSRDLGKISLTLTSKFDRTLIQAKFQPFHWIYKYNIISLLFALMFITLMMLLFDRSNSAILIVVSAWLIFPTILYLMIIVNRYQLKKYLQNFLEDLDIREKLQPTLVWQKTG
ncbi:MAG: hypothetical protein V5804_15160 [Mucilaginibacter sp.]|uniref:hypothetical protein n=1 Tax=Mucilaginibacter sp. TaxID=1882438 RepID=UPI0034E3E939